MEYIFMPVHDGSLALAEKRVVWQEPTSDKNLSHGIFYGINIYIFTKRSFSHTVLPQVAAAPVSKIWE